MELKHKERQVLRELAEQVLEISQHPDHERNIRLWKDKNSLRRCRPLILCTVPEGLWPELLPESALQIDVPLFRSIERDLRRRIYRWNWLRDDEVITPTVYMPITHAISDWIEGRHRPYCAQAGHSAGFEPCILKFSDLKKLRFPELTINRQQSDEEFDSVREALGDILDVERGAPYTAGNYHSTLGWGTSFIDLLAEMRGLNQLFVDLVESPEFVHEAMGFLMNGVMRMIDKLEEAGILRLNNKETLVGPGGQGFSDELPGPDADPCKVTARQLWGYAMAQEFSDVSPGMLEEFVLPYQAKALERFGLNYYGCCEPNDRKFTLIQKYIPRLRALSVSPWARHETAVAAIEDKYIYSWKPNPSTMIMTFDEDYIRNEIRRVFDITRDCHVVASLRDVETVCHEPRRLSRWVAIAREEADPYEGKGDFCDK